MAGARRSPGSPKGSELPRRRLRRRRTDGASAPGRASPSTAMVLTTAQAFCAWDGGRLPTEAKYLAKARPVGGLPAPRKARRLRGRRADMGRFRRRIRAGDPAATDRPHRGGDGCFDGGRRSRHPSRPVPESAPEQNGPRGKAIDFRWNLQFGVRDSKPGWRVRQGARSCETSLSRGHRRWRWGDLGGARRSLGPRMGPRLGPGWNRPSGRRSRWRSMRGISRQPRGSWRC